MAVRMFMESERLWFRALELDDAPLLAQWLNHPEIRRHLDSRVFPFNLDEEKEYIKRVTTHGGTPGSSSFLFGPKGGEAPIGTSSLFAINWIKRECEWGIIIGERSEWGKGYGREVATRMLEYGLQELNLNRVQLRVQATHPAGIKAYEAAGYVREGVLRERSWDGQRYVDEVVMSVLRREWDQRGGR